MRKKKLTSDQLKVINKLALKKVHYDNRLPKRKDAEIMSWCNKRGLTIYATCQTNFNIKLFKQFGEDFLPMSDKEYDQYSEDDQLALNYDWKQGYLAYYNKFKDK